MAKPSRGAPVKTLIIDNYDSFTYNLYDLISQVTGSRPKVLKNDDDKLNLLDFTQIDAIVISPGPGRPERAKDIGFCSKILENTEVPTLGICLGHQAIADSFGGKVRLAPVPIHGKRSEIFHNATGLFADIPTPFKAVRYHSLYVQDLPTDFEAVAWTSDGLNMGLRHRTRPIWSLQFHPESVCTERGKEIIGNFFGLAREANNNMQSGSIAVTKPLRPFSKSYPQSRELRIAAKKLPIFPKPEVVFADMFCNSVEAFWLDSSLIASGVSRFSFMGDSSGPLSEIVEYKASDRSLNLHRSGKITTTQIDFFEFLETYLAERQVQGPDLPFDFNLGLVGYFGYEMKSLCGGASVHTSEVPDALFIFADRMIVFDFERRCTFVLCAYIGKDKHDAETWIRTVSEKLHQLKNQKDASITRLSETEPCNLQSLGSFRHTKNEYIELIHRCRNEIKQGESYEICLTNHFDAPISLDPFQTYLVLRDLNPAPYSSFLRFSNFAVLSSSPERFLKLNADRIVESKPIKGTRRRGKTEVEDMKLVNELRNSSKDLAENLMIVDLVRNDLNSVCCVGSVIAQKLFDIETYSSVHQMVSTIQGKLREDVSTAEFIRNAFPGGSMTGAPKIRTMEIIDELENGPRGVYSGALGYLSLNGTTDLSIVIRTLLVQANNISFGVGGAIVWDSLPEMEFDEILIKSKPMIDTLNILLRDISSSDEP